MTVPIYVLGSDVIIPIITLDAEEYKYICYHVNCAGVALYGDHQRSGNILADPLIIRSLT